MKKRHWVSFFGVLFFGCWDSAGVASGFVGEEPTPSAQKLDIAFFLTKMGGESDYFTKPYVTSLLTEFYPQAQIIFKAKQDIDPSVYQNKNGILASVLKSQEDDLSLRVASGLKNRSLIDSVIILTLLGLRDVPDDFAAALSVINPEKISPNGAKTGVLVFYDMQKKTFDMRENPWTCGIKRPRDGDIDGDGGGPFKRHRANDGD
jgi:hypothetical protein